MRGGADSHYFPSGRSVLRRVHGARIVGFTYGQRALLMQATDPLAFAGLTANTTGLEAPFKRLAHTAEVMEQVYFGTRAAADRATARVREMHARVRGRLEEPAGPWPAGSEYAADDPRFLLWILVWLADSAQAAYEAFIRRLSDEEREGFWQDYLVVGELFGLGRGDAPASYTEYRAYVEEKLASDELHVTPQAYELGRRVAFDLPVPAHRAPALRLINFSIIGLLPPRTRDLYDLPWDANRRRAFDTLAGSLRAAARITPRRIRRGSSAADYRRVAQTEAERLRPAGGPQ
jgi:uncharacterized protein (DUF2236 family)